MRLTVKAVFEKKKKREKIVALTAYDYPLAKILDDEGIDIILVGDSVGMVLLGYDTTMPVSMRDMMHHARAVSRAVRNALVVADMPFGAYSEPAGALRNAKRFIKEAGADAVKLEGGRKIQTCIKALIQAGIPVMGHLGMTPQSFTQLGGYRVQGRSVHEANSILKDALLLDKLGVFAIVLECIPSLLAQKITRRVKCPTIGIGAGPATDGQILVLHDMLGFEGHVRPKFVRRYAALERIARDAVKAYRQDVLAGKYPSKDESY
ncbi:MAG: 3-methyl-2-oxobutanoate hydroxymethyltransferase [Candidatus Omnitrophica bacterium]|nr:3-methyl-2-oxobutanoate hydroxymethyltransferase [Candidatus Omnitrophota bacterium]